MSKKKNKRVDIPVPLKLVQEYGRRCPRLWEMCELIHTNLASDNYIWDERCYLPLDVFSSVKDTISKALEIEISQNDCPLIVALANWRRYKEIYSFDADFADVLMESATDDIIVEESLKSLPFPSIYIDIEEGNNLDVSGFFVNIDCNSVVRKDMGDERLISLKFVGISSKGNFDGTFIIERNKTIKQSFNRLRQLLQEYNHTLSIESIEYLENFIVHAMQLILYICAINTDISENEKQKTITKRTTSLNNNKNIKDVFREVRKWDVGYKIGKAIRLSNKSIDDTDNNGVTTDLDKKDRKISHAVRPHVRRGHFHHYWMGSEHKGDRRLVLKWTAPAFINFNKESEIVANITPVKA